MDIKQNSSSFSRKKFFNFIGAGVTGTFLLRYFSFGINKLIPNNSQNVKISVKPEPLAVKRNISGKQNDRT